MVSQPVIHLPLLHQPHVMLVVITIALLCR
jgi:hypothetical protein